MESYKKVLAFIFFFTILFLICSLADVKSKEKQVFTEEKFEIEFNIKTEKDLQFLKELGLDCSSLGVCICMADTLQLLSLKKANYNFRPSKRLDSADQNQGIKQSRIIQLKIDIKDEAELNFIKSLGLNCAEIGKCTTEVDIEQMNQLKQNGISFTGIREGIRVEGTSSDLKPAGSTYGVNETDYTVPFFEWTYSPITIDNAPYDALVDEIEVTYDIYDPEGHTDYLRVGVCHGDWSQVYLLWDFEGSGGYYLYETEKISSDFDGHYVNQDWRLWVLDSYGGYSTIRFWCITIWFSGPPVYRVNYYDYSIPEDYDSVNSSIYVPANMAPSNARVTSLDIHYDIIHTYVGDLEIWVTDNDHSDEYVLWGYEGRSNDDIHETVTGITNFNGEMVNQTWRLWASDCCTWDQGYIDFWSITLWYQDLPDLIIKSMIPSNYNPLKDSTISVGMVIKNQGTREAGSFYTGLYYNLSTPPDIYTWKNKEEYVDSLMPGDTTIVTFTGVTSYDTATWNMYGLADCYGYREESDEDNNYIGPKRVKWRDLNSLPDLVIEEAWVSNDCNPTLDESVYVDVVIKNIGGSSTPFLFYTAIFYNRETAPDPSTPEDNWYPTVGYLRPDAIDTFTFVLPNPSYAETWLIWLLVDSDNQATEGNENNNVFGPIYVYWEAPAFKSGTITRAQIIENAMYYVSVEWECLPKNTTPPTKCTKWRACYQNYVTYYGEAYKYGGTEPPWDTKGCFLYNLDHSKKAGSFATNDCIEDDILPDYTGNPSWATGIDCSGLVSRAWDLPSRKGTSQLGGVSTEIQGGLEYLLRGDILLKPGSHTFIFDSWAPDSGGIIDRMFVIEAADFRGDPTPSSEARRNNYRWTIEKLASKGYKPYRYNNVQELSWYYPDSTGDINSDGNVSISDIVYFINFLFKGGPRPYPMWRADVNWDCKASLSDVVYLINYILKSGPALPGCKSSCWNCVNYPVR